MANLRFLVSVVVLVAGWVATGSAQAQDIVGVLPELIKPEVAKRLQLSEDQIAKVRTLISQRMAAVVGLGQQIREAPPTERKQMQADFNAESEKLGLALLDEAQQAGAKQVRVEWLGLLSLEDDSVATSLNLADWQKATVAQWVTKVRDSRRSPLAQKTRDEAERAIRKELSESQWWHGKFRLARSQLRLRFLRCRPTRMLPQRQWVLKHLPMPLPMLNYRSRQCVWKSISRASHGTTY